MTANPCAPGACGSCPLSGMCGDPDDLPADELPADEWCTITGITVLDPDGWREDGLPWDAPITEAEFGRRAMRSTVRMPHTA